MASDYKHNKLEHNEDEHDMAQCLIPASRQHEPDLIGIGFGPINPVFITREAWPIHKEQSRTQYGKFTQLMVNRIRGGESNEVEIERFINMFDVLEHWSWMAPLLEMLPELDEHG